jgi:hypothetical protein
MAKLNKFMREFDARINKYDLWYYRHLGYTKQQVKLIKQGLPCGKPFNNV